jgi:NTP pyrophosphatase (non-canonical NTP hydrolase)
MTEEQAIYENRMAIMANEAAMRQRARDYQQLAHATSLEIDEEFLYPNQVYAAIGLANEAGEVAGVAKKAIRGDFGSEPTESKSFQKRMEDELGDVCWYLAECCTQFGFDLNEIMSGNVDKLKRRSANGTIMGDGER